MSQEPLNPHFNREPAFQRPDFLAPKPLTDDDTLLSPLEMEEAARRLDEFKSGFILYPALRPIMEAMNSLIPFGNLGRANGASCRCMLITGPTRTGKTTLLANFESLYLSYWSGGRLKIPVLRVSLPSDCSKRDVAVAILKALKAPDLKGTLTQLMVRVENNLIKQGVLLLILDEFHHLMSSENSKVLEESSEYIKSILEKNICSIVMCGIDAAAKVYEGSAQVKGRSIGRFAVKPLRFEDEHDRAVLDVILKEYHQYFPLKLEVELYSEGMAWRLHLQSKGHLGRIADFLAAVAMLAFIRGMKSVGLELFLEVAENMRDADNSWVNPFTLVDGFIPTNVVMKEMVKSKVRRRERKPKPSDIPSWRG
jgi:hypothetical protein